MFLNAIKFFFIKKSLKKKLFNEKVHGFTKKVQTVGLLVDESKFDKTASLLSYLVANGFYSDSIKVLVFKENYNKKKQYNSPVFGFNDFNWNGLTTNSAVVNFQENEFDMLISYYDIENVILLQMTNQSKAKFKAGFSITTYNLNDLSIKTDIENYSGFVTELIKYLKILNKI